MFPRLVSLINTLIPDRVRHRWNRSRALSAMAAIMLVMALMPIPKDLRSLFAAVPGGVVANDIVVESNSDTAAGVPGVDTNCTLEVSSTPSNTDDGLNCRLRDALAFAGNYAERLRIVFDSTVTDITLNSTLDISHPYGVDINGPITSSGVPQVTIRAAASGFTGVKSSCGVGALSALVTIYSLNTRLAGVSLVEAEGNAVEVVNDAVFSASGADDVMIENNFIGTNTRTSFDASQANGGHGICVSAQDGDIAHTIIRGNIIVNSQLDGIRVQGMYTGVLATPYHLPTEYRIYNNLIGNLNGNDQDPSTGNHYSGITVSNVIIDKPNSTIDHNIITNNGFGDGTHFVGDGITLLNAWATDIASNYIGTAQTFSAVDSFPFTVNGSGALSIPAVQGVSNYSAAPNACDGIAIRYYDHLSGVIADGTYHCGDPDLNTTTASGGTLDRTYSDASLGGPSIFNRIYDNEIGSNNRNGIYIQSVACRMDLPTHERSNLLNYISGTGGLYWPVQNANNSILQNSIFTNDNSTSVATGSGSYGIGIDLEDYATANLDSLDNSMTFTYWNSLFTGASFDSLNCGATVPSWEPQQPTRTGADTNITENDSYPTTADAGLDPDAGANRLINTPIINSDTSAPDAIRGTAAEDTVVELFQVYCEGGDGLTAVVPVDPQDSMHNCDTDFWDEATATGGSAIHTHGHGQGYRFLGSAYVPINADADLEGSWVINPSDFVGSSDYGVAAFTGGLVTATATGFGNRTACWDIGPCDLSPASIDFGAQRLSSVTGTGGLWNPPSLPADDCLALTPPTGATFYTDTRDGHSWFDCAGPTSEFSPNALVISPATYSLTKTANPAVVTQSGSTVYTITATNRSDAPVVFGTGSLSDTLPATLDLLSCTWSITGTSGTQPCAGSGSDILGNTNFGALHITGDQVVITVTAHVHSDIAGSACTITNTVGTGSTMRDIFGAAPTETVSSIVNHQAIVTVSDCAGQPVSHYTNVEKLVSVNSGDFFTADASGTAVDALRGDSVSYLFHFANISDQTATGSITDNFPSTLVRGTRTISCWLNTDPNDNTPDVSTITGCTHDLASGRFDSSGTTGIQDFGVPANQYLHILVTGYSVSATQALNTAPVCNTVTTVSGGLTVQDNACIHILDPGLAVYKSILLNGTETSVDVSTGAPGALAATDITYFIDVGNTSASAPLNGLVVDDDFPTGLAGTLASPWTCAFYTPAAGALINHVGPYTGACTVTLATGVITGLPTQLAANQMLHIRLTGLRVPVVTTTTPLCNSVTARTSLTALTANDTACFRAGSAGLHIVKSANPTTPAPGTVVTYTLTVSNPGVTTLTNVSVVDDLDDATLGNNLLPVCVTSISQVTPLDGGAINTSTNTVTWTIATLNSGATQALRFTASTNPLLTATTSCHNTAVVSAGSQVSTDQSSVDISVQPSSGTSVITIDKTALSVNQNTVYAPGDTVRYRVTLNNNTSATAGGLTVKDIIPAAENNLTNVTATSGTVSSTSLSSGEVQVNNISIAGQGTQSVTYDARLLDESHFPLASYRLHRGAESADDDFYPARVRSSSVEANSDHSDADDALSAPDEAFVSLGERGQMTLSVSRSQTAEKFVVDGDGDDFCVLEVDPATIDDNSTEQYVVEVSQTTHSSDFERVGRVNRNSNCFDLEDADMTWARYIRIRDMSNSVTALTPGADINAVCLLHIGGFVTNTAEVLSGTTVLGSDAQSILVDFTDAFDNPPSARDCRERTVVTALAPLPLPPPPASSVSFFPALPLPPIQLPKTGAETLPFMGTGLIIGAIGWIARRKS